MEEVGNHRQGGDTPGSLNRVFDNRSVEVQQQEEGYRVVRCDGGLGCVQVS